MFLGSLGNSVCFLSNSSGATPSPFLGQEQATLCLYKGTAGIGFASGTATYRKTVLGRFSARLMMHIRLPQLDNQKTTLQYKPVSLPVNIRHKQGVCQTDPGCRGGRSCLPCPLQWCWGGVGYTHTPVPAGSATPGDGQEPHKGKHYIFKQASFKSP